MLDEKAKRCVSFFAFNKEVKRSSNFLHVQWEMHGEVEKTLNLLQNSNSLRLFLTNLNLYK